MVLFKWEVKNHDAELLDINIKSSKLTTFIFRHLGRYLHVAKEKTIKVVFWPTLIRICSLNDHMYIIQVLF